MVRAERYLRMKAELGPRLLRQNICGLHVHVSVPDPDTCLRAFEGVVPASAAPARAVRELAVLGRRAERLALDPLADPPRDADGRDAAGAAQLGRLGGRDRRRQHAPPLGRVAAAGVRHARGARHGPADVGAADGRARGRGAAARARGGPETGSGEPFDREEYARERERAGREGGGPEAERQLELGPEAALAELVELTLR